VKTWIQHAVKEGRVLFFIYMWMDRTAGGAEGLEEFLMCC